MSDQPAHGPQDTTEETPSGEEGAPGQRPAMTSIDDIVAEFAVHRSAIERIMATVTDNGDRISKQLAAIDRHLTNVPGGPWSWKHLKAAQRAALWYELFEWVEWLQSRYMVHLSQERFGMRPCWYRHPLAVEYLTALMVSHQATYAVHRVAPSAGLVDWHEKSFWPIMRYLGDVWGGCTALVHVEPELTPIVFDRDDFERMVLHTTTPEKVDPDRDFYPTIACRWPHDDLFPEPSGGVE